MTKSVCIITLLSLSFSIAVAQNKTGFIDMDSVISSMPETTQANIILTKFQDSLGHAYEGLQRSADSITDRFKGCGDYMQPEDSAAKSLKRDNIVKLYQRIQNFNAIAQNLAKQKAQEIFKPIQVKAMAAIGKVAVENNYTYILDINAVKFASSDNNLMALVIKALGITESATTVITIEKDN